VATKYASGQCYAYVGYDSLYTNFFGFQYMRANLAIVNITSEGAPFLAVATQRFPSTTQNAFSAFGSISTASLYTNSVGWFFYSQAAGPCNTSYVGYTNRNLGLTGRWAAQSVDTGFPTLKAGGADYVGIVKRGLPGGSLFPTWHRAVPSTGTNSGCVSCLGANYSVAIYGSQVTP